MVGRILGARRLIEKRLASVGIFAARRWMTAGRRGPTAPRGSFDSWRREVLESSRLFEKSPAEAGRSLWRSRALTPARGASAGGAHGAGVAHFFELAGFHVVDEASDLDRVGARGGEPGVVEDRRDPAANVPR